MSGPYVAAFLIKGSYGELTPHPALRGHLQSTRQEPSTAVALRHAPAGAAPRGKAFHAISPASTATFNRRFPFPVRLFLARASAFKIFAAPSGVSPPHCSCP